MIKKTETEAALASKETGGTGVKRRSRVSDILLLVMSVIIAFMMWLYVSTLDSPSYEQMFTSIPITILEEGSPLSVYYGYNNVLDVKIMGSRRDMTEITASDISAVVDIGDISEAGRYTLPVKITVPQGMSIVSQSVNSIAVYLDNRSSATIPVTAKITSYQLAEGYEIGESDIRLSLNEISVTGPESVLATIASAQAELQLGQVSGSVVIVSGLKPVDDSGQPVTSTYISMSASTVTATVPVYMYKTLPLEISYKYGYLDETNSAVSVSPSAIRVKGEVGTLNSMDSIALAPIDEKKLLSDAMQVSITLPGDLTNVDGIDKATVTVQHLNTETAQLVVDNITVKNPNNLKYELLNDSLNVTLRGDSLSLTYISPADIEATVDLSYLKSDASGTTSVAAVINISESFSDYIYELGDYRVSVKLK